MKVSLNVLRAMKDHDGAPADLVAAGADKIIEKIGAQLGGIDEIERIGEKYQGIIVAHVVRCEKHPNADKLSVCMIDDGGAAHNVTRNSDGTVQVVCGAPNVRAGIKAAWLPPGTTVPDSVGKEPFVLGAREIRGQISNGMLASPKELALWDSHAGILEIEGDVEPGTAFADAFNLHNDAILDIENKMFTHRPDCFGWLGIAREVAGIQHMPYQSPAWYVPEPHIPQPNNESLPLRFVNGLPELVPRFTAVTMSNIAVKPSPTWLHIELAIAGLRPINNVVDLTNYYMLLTGQPLHAYDYDKVKALSKGEATLMVRQPKSGEKLLLLSGKEVEPRPEAIMIATDKQLIGIGGVMGGADTEVDGNTKNIILECANFDMYSIRRTSMAHGLFTDAVTRFTKGQSPLQNLAVLLKMVEDIERLAGGSVASQVIDDNHIDKTVLQRGSLHPAVTVAASFVNDRLGLTLSPDEMKTLLENVEFKAAINNGELTVQAPFWRTDIGLREDVVEEIGRLYGYDHLPLELPLRAAEPTAKNPLLETKSQIREKLSKAGANEILTYSFVHGKLLDKAGQNRDDSYQLANALSPDLQFYRLSLMPSLLEKVHPNIKAGYDEFALFEMGTTHSLKQVDDSGFPGEYEFTALVVAAADKLKKPGAAYYAARKYLVDLAAVPLEFKQIAPGPQPYAVMQPYEPNRSALVNIKNGPFLGIIGEFKASVAATLKLPAYTAGFEVDTQVLQTILSQQKSYTPLPRFPKVTQDITLKVPVDTQYETVASFVSQAIDSLKPKNSLQSLTPIAIYQSDDDLKHRNITFRLSLASYDRTLTDAEANTLLEAVAGQAKEAIKAERI